MSQIIPQPSLSQAFVEVYERKRIESARAREAEVMAAVRGVPPADPARAARMEWARHMQQAGRRRIFFPLVGRVVAGILEMTTTRRRVGFHLLPFVGMKT